MSGQLSLNGLSQLRLMALPGMLAMPLFFVGPLIRRLTLERALSLMLVIAGLSLAAQYCFALFLGWSITIVHLIFAAAIGALIPMLDTAVSTYAPDEYRGVALSIYTVYRGKFKQYVNARIWGQSDATTI